MSNTLAKVAGFFLVPVVGGIAARAVATVLPESVDLERRAVGLAAIATASYAAVAYGAWSLSKQPKYTAGEQAFARGGMWGSMFSAALVVPATAISMSMDPKKTAPAIAGNASNSSDHFRSLANILTGGAMPASPQSFAARSIGRG